MATATPNGMSNDAFLATGTAVLCVTGVFVIVRGWADIRHARKLYLDDYISVLAVLLVAGAFGLTCKIATTFTNPSTSPYFLAQLATGANTLVALGQWASKVPILLLYNRIFGVKRWLHLSSYIIIGVTFVIFTSALIATNLACAPTRNLTLDFVMACSVRGARMGVYTGSASVAADIVIILLPLPVIAKLQLAKSKKIGLCVCFLTGILAMAAGVVSLYYKALALQGSSSDITTAMISTVIEACVALMVGCSSAIYSFWVDSVVGSAFYSLMSSVFSQATLRGSRKSTRSRSTDQHSSSSRERIGDPEIGAFEGSVPHSMDGSRKSTNHATLAVPLDNLQKP